MRATANGCLWLCSRVHEIYGVEESERGREIEAACQLEYVESSSVSKEDKLQITEFI